MRCYEPKPERQVIRWWIIDSVLLALILAPGIIAQFW